MNATLLVAFFNVLYNYIIQVYLERFETLNCTCAYDPRRDISKSMLMMFYVIIVGKYLFPDVPLSMRYFVLIFTFIFDIVFISYIFSIKQKRCSCKNVSQDIMTTTLYYYYLLLVFLFLLSISIIILILPLNLFIGKK